MGILDFFRRKKKGKPLFDIDSNAEVNISIIPKNVGKIARKPVKSNKSKKSSRRKAKKIKPKKKKK